MDKPKAERVAAYRDPALARDGVGGRRAGPGGGLPDELGRPSRWPSRARTPSWSDRPVAVLAEERGLHAARRHARRLAGRRPRGAVLVGAGQRRPRRDRLAAAARQRAARAGRLGRARLAALRRLLLDRPARQLGARPRRHAARAGHPQADGRAGRRLRARRPGHASRWARRPTCASSTRRRWRPGRCAGSATSRPTASA